jgi:TrmH family RNA methyltransferase
LNFENRKARVIVTLSLIEKKKLRSLLTKKGRESRREFLAEGVRLLEESIRWHRLPRKVYYCRARSNERLETLINQFDKEAVPIQPISTIELNQISDTLAGQGIIALFDIPQHNLDKAVISDAKMILLLDNISDPGNAGTLIRSALAFGIDLVLTTSNAVEIYNPKVVRSSAGAMFGLPVLAIEPTALVRLKKEENFRVLAADLRGETVDAALSHLKEKDNLILAIGAEASGLTASILKLADIRIRIPHEKAVESLNAAVAGSIIMKELYNRRTVDKR